MKNFFLAACLTLSAVAQASNTAFFPQDQLFIRSKNPLWVFECLHTFTPYTDESYNAVCAKWQMYLTKTHKEIAQNVEQDLGLDSEHVLGLLYNQNVIQIYMDFTETQISAALPWSQDDISPEVTAFVMSKFAYQPNLPELYLRTSRQNTQTLSKAFGAHKDYSILMLSENVSADNVRTVLENFNHESCTYVAVDNPNIHLARAISLACFLHFDFMQAYGDLLHQTDFTNFVYRVVANGDKKLSAQTLKKIEEFFVIRKFIETSLNALNPLEAALFFIEEEPFNTYKTTFLEFIQDIKTCYHEDIIQFIYATLLERKKDILRPNEQENPSELS